MIKWEYAKAKWRYAGDGIRKNYTARFVFEDVHGEKETLLFTNNPIEELNKIGKEGWEMITQEYDKINGEYFWTFKRQAH